MVEAGGFEPPSEGIELQTSPGAVSVLKFSGRKRPLTGFFFPSLRFDPKVRLRRPYFRCPTWVGARLGGRGHLRRTLAAYLMQLKRVQLCLQLFFFSVFYSGTEKTTTRYLESDCPRRIPKHAPSS